jgi:hypothetical protein
LCRAGLSFMGGYVGNFMLLCILETYACLLVGTKMEVGSCSHLW